MLDPTMAATYTQIGRRATNPSWRKRTRTTIAMAATAYTKALGDGLERADWSAKAIVLASMVVPATGAGRRSSMGMSRCSWPTVPYRPVGDGA